MSVVGHLPVPLALIAQTVREGSPDPVSMSVRSAIPTVPRAGVNVEPVALAPTPPRTGLHPENPLARSARHAVSRERPPALGRRNRFEKAWGKVLGSEKRCRLSIEPPSLVESASSRASTGRPKAGIWLCTTGTRRHGYTTSARPGTRSIRRLPFIRPGFWIATAKRQIS
jgi:hypothetical protein